MTLEERIQILIHLGKRLLEEDDYYMAVAKRCAYENPWFTVENIQLATRSIANAYLSEPHLRKWMDHYKLGAIPLPKNVALVLSGQTPLEGFHDVLCVFVMGHYSQIKLADSDKYLLPYLVKLMKEKDEASRREDRDMFAKYFEFVERLKDFDAVIAANSNKKSDRYFKTYFGKYPHIIRQQKNGVAILEGKETSEDLKALAKDVFQYFGLSNRSVAKLYVPKDYDFQLLLEVFHQHNKLVLNSKYKNNFDYNTALLMMNSVPYLSNGAIVLKEDTAFQSRIATLHYEFYTDKKVLVNTLLESEDAIACVVSIQDLPKGLEEKEIVTIPFGTAHELDLMNYGDGVDTMDFLLTL